MTDARFRTLGPDCGCDCLTDEDSFQRADEDFDGGADSTGRWSGDANDGTVGIVANQIEMNFESPGTGPPELTWVGLVALPDNWMIRFGLRMATDGPTNTGCFKIAMVSTTDQVLMLKIQQNSENAIINLLDDGETPQGESWIVPHYNDDYQYWKLCYDVETQRLAAEVLVSDGKRHRFYISPAEFTGSPESFIFKPYINGDGDGNGFYHIDDFQLFETKSDENSCSCCSPHDCGDQEDQFDDAELDPRWHQESGTWDESGDSLNISEDSAKIEWLASHMGIAPDCSLDDTTLVKVSVKATGDDVPVRIGFGDNYVELLMSSTAATLTLSSGETDDLPSHSPGTVLELCFASYGGKALVARCEDVELVSDSGVETDDAALPWVGTGTGADGKDVQFLNFYVRHNLYSLSCDDCTDGVTEVTPCLYGGVDVCVCEDHLERVPAVVKWVGSVTGQCQDVPPAGDPPMKCDDIYRGSYVVQLAKQAAADNLKDPCEDDPFGPNMPAQCILRGSTGDISDDEPCAFNAGNEVMFNITLFIMKLTDDHNDEAGYYIFAVVVASPAGFEPFFVFKSPLLSVDRRECSGIRTILRYKCTQPDPLGPPYPCDPRSMYLRVRIG